MYYSKLQAQKLLLGKNTKAFFVSIMPVCLAMTLLYVSYYLLNFLKNNSLIPLTVKILLAVADLFVSALTVTAVKLLSEAEFYKKATNGFAKIRVSDVFCSLCVSALKVLIFFSWSAALFAPSAVLGYCAYLSEGTDYPERVTATLTVSAIITALVGAGCFFVLWGRYSKTYFVQLATGETNPLKVMAESTLYMEGVQLKYALFRLSFLGWGLLCLLIFPMVYVLPYRKCAKYVFFTEKKKQKNIAPLNEKPIVFIFG